MLNGFVKVIFGLLLIVAGIFLTLSYAGWMQAVKDVLQGSIVLGLVLFGLLFCLLGVTDMND
ncbi:hypothetical protein CL622_05780 [archaeon]|nr:hypothetical protein [archaeon]|tara:strand:+ start:1156 stop:1341 length:186 start_codon:yes stop_codon:yes gene_type:complete